jgi:hypothetical protein
VTVFAEIRHACARVAERAREVRIDDAGLHALADRLASEALSEGPADPAHLRLGDDDATLAFVLLLDALNFGSGWSPVLWKPSGNSGYFTMANALRAFCEENGPPEAAELRGFTPARCAALFGQEGNHAAAPLMALFARSLRELGGFVETEFGGRYGALVGEAGGLAGALVATLARMPLYRDVSEYAGLRVPFFKRAQITCSDLAHGFGGEGYGAFVDLDELTIFADNLVPHVLRVEGALVYDAALARRIDRGELLPSGSSGEVEIRAVALVAVERLVPLLARRGRDVTPRSLDTLLWSLGQVGDRKSVPRHRTQCSYY